MKLKHFLSFFTFFACFGVSAWLFAVPVRENSLQINPDSRPSFKYLQTQKQILEFLEKDRQTGRELENDRIRFRQNSNERVSEELATVNLVKKMQYAKCTGLPDDFCMAWNNHVKAWEKMAEFRYNENLPNDLVLEDYQGLNRDINQTYQDLILSAKKHGVDFQY